jgi:hypothetical protein
MKIDEAPTEKIDAFLGHVVFQQAKDQPNLVAVNAWDGNFTYAELLDFLVKFAAVLFEKGVDLEEQIPICFKESEWAIGTMFGISLAGGIALDRTCHAASLPHCQSLDCISSASAERLGLSSSFLKMHYGSCCW